MSILSLIPDQYASSKVSLVKVREEAAFPFGLAEKGLHECVENKFGDMSALAGFVLANVKSKGAILWVKQYKLTQEHGALLPSGTRTFQNTNSPCLHVKTSKRMDVLWTVEEGIKSGGVSLVIGEVDEADFTATRRLKLASERYGVPVVLLMPHTREGISACETRWRISSKPSKPNPYDVKAPGFSCWQAKLERCRPAPARVGDVFDLEYDDEALSLRVVSGMAARQAKTHKTSADADKAIKISKTA